MRPAAGTSLVPANQTVTVTFNETLAGPGGVVLTGANGNVIPMNAALSSDSMSIILNGSLPIDGETVTINVTQGVTDFLGRNPLAQQTSQFNVIDLTPPVVASTTPANGAIQVDPSGTASIVITFNKPLQAQIDPNTLVSLTVGDVVRYVAECVREGGVEAKTVG